MIGVPLVAPFLGNPETKGSSRAPPCGGFKDDTQRSHSLGLGGWERGVDGGGGGVFGQ